MSNYPDLDAALERAKAEINRQFSLESVEKERQRTLEGLEALFLKRLADLEALRTLAGDIVTKGVIPFRTKAIEVRDGSYDGLRLEWREYDLKATDNRSSSRWQLPPGRWRLLILAMPVGPEEKLSEWDKAGLREG